MHDVLDYMSQFGGKQTNKPADTQQSASSVKGMSELMDHIGNIYNESHKPQSQSQSQAPPQTNEVMTAEQLSDQFRSFVRNLEQTVLHIEKTHGSAQGLKLWESVCDNVDLIWDTYTVKQQIV